MGGLLREGGGSKLEQLFQHFLTAICFFECWKNQRGYRPKREKKKKRGRRKERINERGGNEKASCEKHFRKKVRVNA